jgi:hypothetical protein
LDEKTVLVVQEPDRPDHLQKVLARCESVAAAAEWLSQWRQAQAKANKHAP